MQSSQTFDTGIDHPLQKRATENLEDAAVSAVHSRLGLSSDDVVYKSGYSAEAASHGYVRQQVVSILQRLSYHSSYSMPLPIERYSGRQRCCQCGIQQRRQAGRIRSQLCQA